MSRDCDFRVEYNRDCDKLGRLHIQITIDGIIDKLIRVVFTEIYINSFQTPIESSVFSS